MILIVQQAFVSKTGVLRFLKSQIMILFLTSEYVDKFDNLA